MWEALDSAIGIGDLATIVTLAGVTIYVLGLVGLAIPIYRTFTDDLVIAWYAVSLLPRTVVAGQGVRLWVQWPLFITAALLLIKSLPTEALSAILMVSLLIMLFPIYIFGQVARLVLNRGKGWIGETISWLLAFSGVLTVLVVWMVFETNIRIVLETGVTQVPEFETGVMEAPDVPLIYRNLLLFAGSFLVGLPMAITAYPPLPKVKITKQAAAMMEGNPTEGHLVAHSDGFWHLFDQNNELLSIPDAQVLAVRVVHSADAPPAEESAATEETTPREDTRPGEEKVK